MMCWIETACLKVHSGLRFTKLLEEAKWHYRYFGDNQTVKHSVVTHFKLCSNSQEAKHRIQNLGSSVPIAVITDGIKVKKSFFPERTCEQHRNLFNFILFCFSSRKEPWGNCPCQQPSQWLWWDLPAEFYLFRINSYGCFLSFGTAKGVGWPWGLPGNNTKTPPRPRLPISYLLHHDSLYMEYMRFQSSS